MGYGDEIMASSEVERVRALYPDSQICLKGKADKYKHEIFKNNPHLSSPAELDKDKEVRYVKSVRGRRPYHSSGGSKKCVKFNYDFKANSGTIYFDEEEQKIINDFRDKYKSHLVVVPDSKSSFTKNKNWNLGSPTNKWQELVHVLDEFNFIQLGGKASRSLEGVTFINTHSFRQALCVLSAVRGIISTEGGLHHGAAALGKPGVVIFGGFTPPEITGYDLHVNLYIDENSPCGSLKACKHCEECMSLITVDMVAKEVRKLFSIS